MSVSARQPVGPDARRKSTTCPSARPEAVGRLWAGVQGMVCAAVDPVGAVRLGQVMFCAPTGDAARVGEIVGGAPAADRDQANRSSSDPNGVVPAAQALGLGSQNVPDPSTLKGSSAAAKRVAQSAAPHGSTRPCRQSGNANDPHGAEGMVGHSAPRAALRADRTTPLGSQADRSRPRPAPHGCRSGVHNGPTRTRGPVAAVRHGARHIQGGWVFGCDKCAASS